MPQLDDEGGTILTDLCAICHVNAVKYTCPRCSIHTCSLPCVKKHKQWAQCSGVRDPAEYRKRADLTTPASIDKDFNFITKVERSIQRADGNVLDRGIDLTPARLKFQHASNKSKVESEAEIRNITIIRAPKGLSRSKSNRTHWHGATKCILWTIEWVDHKDQKRINNVHEFKTVAEAYIGTFGKKAILKRKRYNHDDGKQNQRNGHNHDLHSDEKIETASSVVVQNGLIVDATSKTRSPEDEMPTQHRLGTSEETHAEYIPPVQPAEHVLANSSTTDKTEDNLTEGLYFYLLHPNTEARYKVLIPLPPDQALREAVNNRTILEFPSIYVLQASPQNLVPPFLLEEEYNIRHGNDIPINVTAAALSSVEEGNLEDGEVEDITLGLPVDLDESKVLEVLAKDLGS